MINNYAVGKSLYLRSPTIDDVGGRWYQWFSDREITQYLGDRYWPNTIEMQRDFFESNKTQREKLILSICHKENDEHIGVCSLASINWVHRFAELSLIIGEKKYRNGLFAIETVSLLLNIAFNRLNLNNIKASYNTANPHTPVLLKIFGFSEVGRFKKIDFFEGNYYDSIFLQLSREAWSERNKVN